MAIKEYSINELVSTKNPIANFKKNIDGIDVLKISHFLRNFYKSDIKIKREVFYKLKKQNKVLKENDILISRVGTIGKVFIVDKYLKDKYISDNFIWLSLINKTKIIPRYLFFFFKKQEKLLKNLNCGSTQPLITKSQILNIKIFLPDIQTQQEIINIIEPFEKLKESLITKIQELNKIFINFKDENIEQKIYLKNISSIRTGNKNANFASNNGKYRFFTCSLNKIQYCNSFEYNDEVILLAGNGDIGEIQYFNGKFDAYQRTYIIQTNLIGNAYYSLLRNKNFFKNNSKGSVVKFLTLSTIQNIKINLDEDKNDIRYKVIRLIFEYEQILLILNEIIKQLIELYLI